MGIPRLSLLFAGGVLSWSAPGIACSHPGGPGGRIASGYDFAAISAVALVRVSGAERRVSPAGTADGWLASADVERVVEGTYQAGRVQFDQGGSCEGARPPPSPGSRWVLYFWRRTEGDQPVWAAFPLATAISADPVLALRIPMAAVARAPARTAGGTDARSAKNMVVTCVSAARDGSGAINYISEPVPVRADAILDRRVEVVRRRFTTEMIRQRKVMELADEGMGPKLYAATVCFADIGIDKMAQRRAASERRFANVRLPSGWTGSDEERGVDEER